jgi:hypothetical protein
MLEYGEAYLEANDRIIDAMSARMSPEAVALAYRMAEDASENEEDELDEAA